MFVLWIQFAIAAGIIVIAGLNMSRLADVIAEKTGINKGFIGIVLLALATSLPELVVSAGAVVFEKTPNLALGNVFGSNVFNLLVVFFMEIFYIKSSVFSKASKNNITSASFGILLMSIPLFAMCLYNFTNIKPFTVGFGKYGIGIDTIMMLLIYLFGLKLLFSKEEDKEESEENKEGMSLGKAIAGFVFLTLIIVIDGLWMTKLGSKLSVVTGWGQTFVGSIFIALATSLPELVVSIGAVRIGQIDMAFGNILGSNMFNMLILVISDFMYTAPAVSKKGSAILSIAEPGHVFSGIIAIFITAVVMIGIVAKKHITFTKRNISVTSILILVSYLIGSYILFLLGTTK